MNSVTPRKCWIILVVLVLSACNFNPGNANEPPGIQSKPSQVKVLISQVIYDESSDVRGGAQLELELSTAGRLDSPNLFDPSYW